MPTKTKVKIMPAQAAIRAQELLDHLKLVDELFAKQLAEGELDIDTAQIVCDSRRQSLTNIEAYERAAAPRCWPS